MKVQHGPMDIWTKASTKAKCYAPLSKFCEANVTTADHFCSKNNIITQCPLKINGGVDKLTAQRNKNHNLVNKGEREHHHR
jgi:hypothetical protein